MLSSILETLGTVTTDGRLELDQKVTLYPSRVKVRVESVEVPAPRRRRWLSWLIGRGRSWKRQDAGS
jgi:hypothetical protein